MLVRLKPLMVVPATSRAQTDNATEPARAQTGIGIRGTKTVARDVRARRSGDLS